MPNLSLTDSLRHDYDRLFSTCAVRPQYQAEIDTALTRIIAHKDRYAALAQTAGVPWTLIAVLHAMECGQNFNRHLHNGDPLDRPTVQVPKGRPPGKGPWTWEQSATDALTIQGFQRWKDWSVAGVLYKLECYNGTGYRLYHPSVLSPYLWSYSNHYSAGKYKADGAFSASAQSKQPGTAVLLRRLAEKGETAFVDQPGTQPDTPPLVVSYMHSAPTDPTIKARAVALQQWLTSHTGIYLRPDGWAGDDTSAAYQKVTGHYLPGDPRG